MMSHFQFFHNSQFNVLFDILSYIVQIEVANITYRVVRKKTCIAVLQHCCMLAPG